MKIFLIGRTLLNSLNLESVRITSDLMNVRNVVLQTTVIEYHVGKYLVANSLYKYIHCNSRGKIICVNGFNKNDK